MASCWNLTYGSLGTPWPLPPLPPLPPLGHELIAPVITSRMLARQIRQDSQPLRLAQHGLTVALTAVGQLDRAETGKGQHLEKLYGRGGGCRQKEGKEG